MIVLDASVVVELLTNGALASSIVREMVSRDDPFIAPHLLDVEVLSAIRGLVAGQRVDVHRIEQLFSDLDLFPAERYAHTLCSARIWELRHTFTAYDAAYIALAEATNSVLYTCDRKLRRGHGAQVF